MLVDDLLVALVWVGFVAGPVGYVLVLWSFVSADVRQRVEYGLRRLLGPTRGRWLAPLDGRHLHTGLALLLLGQLVAAAALGGGWLGRQQRIADMQAAWVEAMVTFEPRLDVALSIEADAATRPPVVRTDLEPDDSRGALALRLPESARDYGLPSSGPFAPRCGALRGMEPHFRGPEHMAECMREDVVAIVRERPKKWRLRFHGDALVYDLVDGRYLGGVVLDIADDSEPMPLGYHVERRVRLAVTGHAGEQVTFEK